MDKEKALENQGSKFREDILFARGGGDEMTERKIALSIEEAADYTGIGRNTLRKLVEWKKLPVLKVGRKVLIKTDILEMFMEANEGRDLRDKGNVKAVTRNVAT